MINVPQMTITISIIYNQYLCDVTQIYHRKIFALNIGRVGANLAASL